MTVLLLVCAVGNQMQDVVGAPLQLGLEGAQGARARKQSKSDVLANCRDLNRRPFLSHIDGGQTVVTKVTRAGDGDQHLDRALAHRQTVGKIAFQVAGEGCGVGGGQVLRLPAVTGITQQLPRDGMQLGRVGVDAETHAALWIPAAG